MSSNSVFGRTLFNFSYAMRGLSKSKFKSKFGRPRRKKSNGSLSPFVSAPNTGSPDTGVPYGPGF